MVRPTLLLMLFAVGCADATDDENETTDATESAAAGDRVKLTCTGTTEEGMKVVFYGDTRVSRAVYTHRSGGSTKVRATMESCSTTDGSSARVTKCSAPLSLGDRYSVDLIEGGIMGSRTAVLFRSKLAAPRETIESFSCR